LDNVTYEHELGPQVVHIYNIRNNGPSTIEEAEVFLLWPLETHAGDPLMYLLNQPETSGNIRCDPTVNVNERDYFIDTDLERKSYLEMAGVAVTNKYYSRAGYHGSNYQGSGVHVEKSGSGSSSSSSSGGGSYSSSSGHSYNRGTASGSSSGGSYSGSTYRGGAAAGSGGGRISTSGGVLTQSDKKILDEEEEEESTGDASYVHRQRAGEVQSGSGGRAGGNYYERTGGSQTGSGSGGSYSSASSWNSSSSNNGPTYTYSSSKNRSGVLGADGKWRYTEASTEHYGNVVLAAGLGGGGSASSGSSNSGSSSSGSRSYGQNQNVNYGDSYSRTSGGSANVARTGGSYRANDG
jgi:integrin alpha 8